MGKSLRVMKGVDGQDSISNEAVYRYKRFKPEKISPESFIEGILSGNIPLLSKAITLIESSKTEHLEQARDIIDKALPFAGNSVRIGITGVPGVGKSTFIESLGNHLINSGHKLAVLAIDPSSEKTKGSILGDKTRMERLSSNPMAYIRPSPSSGTLGGVARKTRESIILCEAAGYDIIFIETVGVGQSETAVYSMVDFFLLLMLAGAGDELQGIKRGIMEMADGIAITKADGENIKMALQAQSCYKNAIHLFPPSPSGWITQVHTCSSRENKGIDEVWNMMDEYFDMVKSNGFFNLKRREQTKYWLYDTIESKLKANFFEHPKIKKSLLEIEEKVLNEKLSPFNAANILLSKNID